MLEWVWHNVPGGALGLLVGSVTTLFVYRYVLLRTLMDLNRRHADHVSKIKRQHDTELADAKQAYIDIMNEIDVRVEQRLKEWWPSPKDMDEAFALAEQMADKRKRMDAGRKTDVRTEGPPSKIHKIKLKKGK